MSHRQKHEHKSRHRTHANKPDRVADLTTLPKLREITTVVRRITPKKPDSQAESENVVAPL